MRNWDNLNAASDGLLAAAGLARDAFVSCGVDFRLIGGLALELQGVDVGTKDIDFLVDEESFDTALQCLADTGAVPQMTTEDGLRVNAREPSVYQFVGLDGIPRPVSFFRLGNVEIDLLGATGPTEKNAMEDVPWLTSTPKGIPVAPIQAIAAIKLAVGRTKDMAHVEMIIAALGRQRAKIVSRYLRTQDRLRDMSELVEEWNAAVERTAAMQPKRR